MIHLPSRPVLLPGEALASALGRGARLNKPSGAQILKRPEAVELLRERTLSFGQRKSLGEALGLSIDGWEAGMWTPELGGAIGDPRTGSASRDPLGWALNQFSVRCPVCHDEGAPWDLLHQTALAWICVRHGRYLSAACGRCNPRAAFLAGSPIRCHHHATDDEAPASELVHLQDTLGSLFSTASKRNVTTLRTLRAASTLAYVDAAHASRSSGLTGAIQNHARTHHSRRRTTGSGKVGLRLERPPHEPWANAHLVRAASRHYDLSTGDLDISWASAVLDDLIEHRFPLHRIEPFTVELGLDLPSRRLQEVHPSWLRLATVTAASLQERGLTGSHIPSNLIDPETEDLWTTPWPTGLARAAMLGHVLSERSLSQVVGDLGHHFTHVTAVRQLLVQPPNNQDRRAINSATAHLTGRQGSVRYAERRALQSGIVRVSDQVLRQLRLDPPRTARVSRGRAAALWLWCVTTSSHLSAAPFVDGRTSRSLGPLLRGWHRQTDPAALLALVDWNESSLRLEDSAAKNTATVTRLVS